MGCVLRASEPVKILMNIRHGKECSVDPYKGKIPPPFGKIFGWSIMDIDRVSKIILTR
jgi:hypothetical protein